MLIEKEIPAGKDAYFEYIEPSSICFDIETTGLNRKYSHTTVIGTGYIRDKKIIFKQWFLENPAREKEMLEEFSAYLDGFESIIQFNGNSFYIPYISERCRLFGLEDPFSDMDIIDLYKSAKRLSGLSALSDLKQKSLERLFNIKRRDRISGRDCIFAYQNYLRYNDKAELDALLLHNEEDVLGLLKIYPLRNLDFIADDITVTDSVFCEASGNLEISFKTRREIPFEISGGDPGYNIHISGRRGILSIRPELCVRKFFFENYKDYYYLPDEDRAIHKSVGAYVDPAHRQRALKSNCYEKISDCFFKQYGEDIRPAFKKDIKDKDFWFRSSDIQNASEEQILALCRGYLKRIFRL